MDTLLEHAWATWLLVALVAGILEMTVPAFVCVFVALGALLAAGVALRWGWPAQLGTFAGASVLSVLSLRPFLLARFPSHSHMPSRSQALVGRPGLVTTAIVPGAHQGRVTVDGADWAATSDRAIAASSSIIVTGHEGIVLEVKET